MNLFAPLRLLNASAHTSGAALAQQLGVSRASISLALQKAHTLGVQVESTQGQGYRLAREIDWLDEPTVAKHLGTSARFFDLKLFDEIDSTNSALLAAAQHGAPSGMVYAAEFQRAGRGRLGRTWHGSLGDTLMASLLWRFPFGVAQLSGLSLAVGVALLRTLRNLGVSQAKLKWPNDVLAPSSDGSFAKLGGVLIEVSGDALGPSAAVIGIGLNVRLPTLIDASALPSASASALDALGYVAGRNVLLAQMLRDLADILPQFERQGFAPLQAEWDAGHAYPNQAVELLQANGQARPGRALGVAADGALRFADARGEHLIHAGEISLRSVALAQP